MRQLWILSFCAVAACGPLVQIGNQDAPPPALLRLSAAPDAPAPTASDTAVLRIVQPQVPAELRTLRITVERDATHLQFLAQGQWVEPPAAQLQRLLLTRIANLTGRLTVDERSADVASEQRLSGRLTAFGLDVRQGPPRAHLRYEALLTSSAAPPRAKNFEIYLPVAQQSASATAHALNQASNILAEQLAQWLNDAPGARAEQGAEQRAEQGAVQNH